MGFFGDIGRGFGAFGRGVAGALVGGGGGGREVYQGAPADPRDPAFTSANAPRVQQDAQGQWTLTEHGNTRVLQPNEVASAQGYATQFWQDNPTGFQMNNPQTISDAYQQFLGRAPDAAGLAANQANPGGTMGALNQIRYGQEAQQRMAANAPAMGAYGQMPPWLQAAQQQAGVFGAQPPRYPQWMLDPNPRSPYEGYNAGGQMLGLGAFGRGTMGR